ncbi:MAG: glycosyltransferase [Betaproteobacteria bacterium]
MSEAGLPMRIVFIVHYFPPVNSSGAKRVEAVSKCMAAAGHLVTVITTRKTSSDGAFTEKLPVGVDVIELNRLGRERPSILTGDQFEPMYTGKPSWKRRIKDLVMKWFGQLPDPRLPFALSIGMPWLAKRAHAALEKADVVVGSSPPWPLLLAATIAKRRFGIPCILDYRDHFSECHEMPGGRFAKWLERHVDRWLLRKADHVVAISGPMAAYYRTMSPTVQTIMNGYDHEVLEAARQQARPSEGRTIVIRYMGIVSPGRVPHNLLQALVRFAAEDPQRFSQLRIEFYGNAALVNECLQNEYAPVRSAFHFFEAVPYVKSLQLMVEANYLLFSETSSNATLSAQGILTTKLFEYIGSGRPILADIAPETLAGSLLLEIGTEHVVANNPEAFLVSLRSESFYQRRPDEVSPNVWKHSRQAQAQEYTRLAEQVTRKQSA